MVLKLLSNKHETAKDLQNKYGLSMSSAQLLADKLHSDYEKFSEFEMKRKATSYKQIALAAKDLGFI